MGNNRKKYLIIIAIIIILVCALFVFILNKQKDSEGNVVNNKESKVELKESEQEITNILKKYYITNNLLDEDNLVEWNFTSVIEIDYTADTSLVYYEIIGNYSCKDDSSSCVYLEQVSDPTDNIYPYKVYIGLDESKEIKSISGVLTKSDDDLSI